MKLDVEPFLDLLFDPNTTPGKTCTGDVNGDGHIDAFDIEPFLNCLFPQRGRDATDAPARRG